MSSFPTMIVSIGTSTGKRRIIEHCIVTGWVLLSGLSIDCQACRTEDDTLD